MIRSVDREGGYRAGFIGDPVHVVFFFQGTSIWCILLEGLYVDTSDGTLSFAFSFNPNIKIQDLLSKLSQNTAHGNTELPLPITLYSVRQFEELGNKNHGLHDLYNLRGQSPVPKNLTRLIRVR